MKTPVRNGRPPGKKQSTIETFFTIMESLWSSSVGQPPYESMVKKKEAVGWACVAAKDKAEEAVDKGKSLSDCLKEAAEELLLKAKELESQC